ncbi:TonB-dependent receptor [Planctobacterium marinum]|uniref:TonB-dependent receptor n=1 Tax=Planctobacterium marinum TaxID=1631968 RepID=UPI001E5F9E95|nr:TonB-dependent receptor [Planctobacterium marinum]MCC2605859.1 TonB-dependent receptor [Planctobacterium marinum]
MLTPDHFRRLPLLAAITASLTGPVAIAEDMPENDDTQVENIVVIGEKIERTLKDTTSSISVIAEEALNSTQFKSVSQAISEIPNVVALSGSVPDIRGVSGNGAAGGFNSISGGAKGRVTTLIDGVAEPFVADLTGDTGLWDVEQIEVYRGPQSTSNGRNSIAGSVFIKTKDPSQNWEGAARLGYRNEDSYVDTSVALSGPLIEDKLAFRVSAQRLVADTITDDQGYASNPPDYDLDEIKTNRIRAKLQWTPSSELKMLLSHSVSNEQGDTGRIYYEAENLDEKNRIFFRDIETDVHTTSLNTGYQINQDFRLDILLAVMDYQWGFDSYEATPEAEQQLIFDENNTTLDARLSFGQSQDSVKGFVGLAYFEREHDVISTGAYPYYGDDNSESVALYTEVSVDVTEKLSLIAGARLERESQLRNFVYGPIDSVLDKDTNIFLPKLVLQYDWTQNTTLALSARKGYNAAGGALNFTEQEYYYFDEEKVDTFELSSRSSFLDGDVFLSANLFYNDYQGYQALSSSRFITNLDSVVTYGMELEVSAKINDNLDLNAGLGLLKTDIKDAGENYPEVEGNELNSAPDITAKLGAKYWLSNTLNVGVSVNYVDEYYGDFNNTPERVAGDYTLVRLQSNYEMGQWLFSAFINNALDEEALLSQEPVSGRYPAGYVSIVDPRNLGVSVTYTF